MRIYTKLKLAILDVIATPSRDGKATYYKLSVYDRSTKEAGMIKCTEDVGRSQFVPMQEYDCTAEYNDTYDPATFRITYVSVADPAGTPPAGNKK